MKHGLTDQQLNREIDVSKFPFLSNCFDGVTLYSTAMGLSPAEQGTVNELYHRNGIQVAMMECLTLWRKHNPCKATYRALLALLLALGKVDIAEKICRSG